MPSFKGTRKDWLTVTGRPGMAAVFLASLSQLPTAWPIHDADAGPPCTCSRCKACRLVPCRGLSQSTFPLRPQSDRLDYPSKGPCAVLGVVSRPSRRLDYPSRAYFPTDIPIPYAIDCQCFPIRLGKSGKNKGVTRCLETALTLSGSGNVLTLSLFCVKSPPLPSKSLRNLFDSAPPAVGWGVLSHISVKTFRIYPVILTPPFWRGRKFTAQPGTAEAWHSKSSPRSVGREIRLHPKDDPAVADQG